jgi:hypothetical protein
MHWFGSWTTLRIAFSVSTTTVRLHAFSCRTSYMCQRETNIENDENRRPVGIAALLDRVEEVLAAERDLATTKAQLEKSSADAMRYWTKCLRWESTYDRAMDEVHRVRTQLRHYQMIDNQRNTQNTILKQRTDLANRKTAALAANCRKQQRELDNVAAALFDAKPSPASVTNG